jgi:hypothetical protein
LRSAVGARTDGLDDPTVPSTSRQQLRRFARFHLEFEGMPR